MRLKFKNTLTGVVLGCLMLVSNLALSQTEKSYEASSLTQLLKSNKTNSAIESNINLTLSKGETMSGHINVTQPAENGKIIIGTVGTNNVNTFHLELINGQLSGQSIVYSENRAFEYFTKNGVVYAKEIDINSLVCTEFKKAKSGNEVTKTVTKNQDPWTLESFPGAPGCVYIDFDGEYVSGTYWNGGDPIDAAPANFSNAKMIEVWEIAAEDFRPFGINVTTSRAVFDTYPKNRRMQAIVTPTNTAAPGSGGVAYIGSFSWNDNTPCWVFNLGTKACGETVSHEIGHTLDLRHDGRTSPSETYYAGQGDWAPIMGASFYDPITHWSKGEYGNANNQEDDLSIMTQSKFGVGYRTDQHGNSINSATTLTIATNGDVLAANNNGIIEKTNDIDYFSFTTSGGNVNLDFNTVARHGNLDILAKLYNSSGTQIATITNPGLNASYSGNLSAGEYFISVEGTGSGDPLTTGYTDYSSLGYFEITGTIPNSGSTQNIAPTVSITSPQNGDLFYDPANFSIEASANDVDGSITKVEFFVNGLKIGEDISAPYSINYSNGVGSYNLEARATDDDGAQTTSSTVIVSVEEQTTGCSVAAWTSSSVYTGGDQASYNGILYQANWWTSGDRPDLNSGQYQVWTAIGPCNQGNTAPTVDLTNPNNGDQFNAPATFTISASANDADGSVVKVDFYINGNLLSSDATAPYEANANITTVGSYDIFAVAEDNEGATTTSSVHTITIENAVNQAPEIVITSPTNGEVFSDPASVTISADASDPDGTVSRVEFFIDGTSVANISTAPYTYTSTFNVGSYDVQAVAYDDQLLATYTNILTFTVEEDINQLPSVSITNPSNGATLIEGQNITITADASDADGSVSMVEFFVNGTLLGGDLTAPYSILWNNLTVGNYDVFAIATDNENGVTTSTYVNVTVIEEGNCSAAAWEASAVYVGGDQVSYNGTLYEAKWWTNNNQPDLFSGTYDVWKNLGACAPFTIESSASESEVSNELLVYPNPSDGKFNISLAEKGIVIITNTLGNIVYSATLNTGVHNLSLDLTSGLYFVNVTSGNDVQTKNIIIK